MRVLRVCVLCVACVCASLLLARAGVLVLVLVLVQVLAQWRHDSNPVDGPTWRLLLLGPVDQGAPEGSGGGGGGGGGGTGPGPGGGGERDQVPTRGDVRGHVHVHVLVCCVGQYPPPPSSPTSNHNKHGLGGAQPITPALCSGVACAISCLAPLLVVVCDMVELVTKWPRGGENGVFCRVVEEEELAESVPMMDDMRVYEPVLWSWCWPVKKRGKGVLRLFGMDFRPISSDLVGPMR